MRLATFCNPISKERRNITDAFLRALCHSWFQPRIAAASTNGPMLALRRQCELDHTNPRLLRTIRTSQFWRFFFETELVLHSHALFADLIFQK